MDQNVINVASIIIAIIIAVTPYFYRRYFARPELTIELIWVNGSSSPGEYSAKNDFSKPIFQNEVIRIFELTWEYQLIIRNNSVYDAFYPEIKFIQNMPKFTNIESLNRLHPIDSKKSVELKAKFLKSEESLGSQRTNPKGFPDELRKIQILLEYKNSYKIKCFTLYDNNAEEKNKFPIRLPKVFKSNS